MTINRTPLHGVLLGAALVLAGLGIIALTQPLAAMFTPWMQGIADELTAALASGDDAAVAALAAALVLTQCAWMLAWVGVPTLGAVKLARAAQPTDRRPQ